MPALYITLPIVATLAVVLGSASAQSVNQDEGITPPKYNRYKHPRHGENATDVKIGIYITDMVIKEAGRKILELTFYLRQTWTDPRLINVSNSGIRYPDGWKHFWVPDTYMRKAVYVTVTHDKDVNPTSLFRVKKGGEVQYVNRITAGFPFDTDRRVVIFRLGFESFKYSAADVTFSGNPKRPGLQIDPELQLKNYNIPKTWTDDCTEKYTIGSYSCLSIVMMFKKTCIIC